MDLKLKRLLPKSNSQIITLIYIFLVFIIIVSISNIYVHTYIKSQKMHTFSYQETTFAPDADRRAILRIEKSELFPNKNSYGIVYDLTLINTTDQFLTDWDVTLQIPRESRVIGFWNSEIFQEGAILKITGEDKGGTILSPNSYDSFGFILEVPEDFILEHVCYSGKFRSPIVKNRNFWILVTLLISITGMYCGGMVVRFILKKQLSVLKVEKINTEKLTEEIMKTFVNFIDAKDVYTCGHSTRVATYAKQIAKQMGYDSVFQRNIYYMGLMHDIGKITIPDEILNKSSKLSADEWQIIQLHTTNGAKLLESLSILPELKDAVLYHHERYDGKGYIHHLKGEEIPLTARIICVADSFDAMHTTRCYRLKFSNERIIRELEYCSGKQFDPKCAQALIDLLVAGEII